MPHNELSHSPEADELMGHIPSCIVRWGIAVIFFIFIGILAGSFFIAAPETISGTLEIKTNPSPENIVAPADGILDTLFCDSYTIVRAGDPIAWIRNGTDYRSIMILQDYIRKFSLDTIDIALLTHLKTSLHLDLELQTRYDIFIDAYATLNAYKRTVKSGLQYEQHLLSLKASVREASVDLSSCIRDRIKTYLLTAPISGQIIHSGSYRIQINEVVASIIPIIQTPAVLYGEMIVINSSYRKLQIGQSVRLDQNAFPDLPRKMLSGTISDLTPLSDREGCRIRVVFPDGILGSHLFRYSKNISAQAKISIDTSRLISKLLPFYD